MNKIFMISLVLLTCIGLSLGVSYAQRPIELSFVCEYPEGHPSVGNALKPWIKEVGELSGGKVKITFYPPNALVPQNDAYDSCVSGMADIVTCWSPRNPGKFPLADVMSLPFVASSAVAGSHVVGELTAKYPDWPKQYKGTELLWQWSGASAHLNTSKKLVKTLDDFKGMKIIGMMPSALEHVKLMGGNPIQMGPQDVYLALERGMAEGIVLPYAAVKSLRVSDVCEYHTTMGMSVSMFYSVMNKERFDSLPPDIKKVFKETTGVKMGIRTSQAIDDGGNADKKWMEGNGHTFYVLPADEREKMIAALSPIYEEYIKKMEGKGYSYARQLVEDTLRFGKEFSKSTN